MRDAGRLCRGAAAASLLATALIDPAGARPPVLKTQAELRLRLEDFATPVALRSSGNDYGLGNGRLRLRLTVEGEKLVLHTALHGAAARATFPDSADGHALFVELLWKPQIPTMAGARPRPGLPTP